MVRLVIEEMGEYLATTLSLRRTIQSSIVPNFLEVWFCQTQHEANDSAVFFDSSLTRMSVIPRNADDIAFACGPGFAMVRPSQ
jgi:hypothetical protein